MRSTLIDQMSSEIGLERVQEVSGAVGVVNPFSDVQHAQLLTQAVGVLRLYACLAACFEKTLETLVLEALDHVSTVSCIDTRVKPWLQRYSDRSAVTGFTTAALRDGR